MKKKYSEILKESLINFDQMQKSTSTVNDILNFKGNGTLPTHKKANNVVSVLERMYHQEDNDLPVVKEGEETRVAQGEGPTQKVVADTKKTKVSDAATEADGVAHPNPNDTNEFDDTISDATTDDKSLATESIDDPDMSHVPGEDDIVEESVFEEGDEDMDNAEIEENLENEPDHEAMGDDSGVKRELKIGDGGTSLSNDSDVGDDEVDGMEQHSHGIPEEVKLKPGTEVNEGDEDPENDSEMSSVPGEDDVAQEMDEELAGDEEGEDEDEDEDEEGEEGGDEEIDDGMDDQEDEDDEEEVGEECEACESDMSEEPGSEEVPGDEEMEQDGEEIEPEPDVDETEGLPAGDELDEGEAQGMIGQNSEDEMAQVPGEDDAGGEQLPDDVNPEEPQEDEEEAPVLDVDKANDISESIIARESTEETIVERLIREMNLEESASDIDEVDLDIDED